MELPKQVEFRDSLDVRVISPRSSIRSDGTPKGPTPSYPTQRADYQRHTPAPHQPGDPVDKSNMYYVDSSIRSLALYLHHLPSPEEIVDYMKLSPSDDNDSTNVASEKAAELATFRPNSPLNPDSWNDKTEDRKRNFRSCIGKVSAVPTESHRPGRPTIALHLNVGTIIRNTKDSDTYVFHTAPGYRGKDKELDDEKLDKLNLIYIRDDQRVSINGVLYSFLYDDQGLHVVPAAERSAMKPSLDTRKPLPLQEPSAATRPLTTRTRRMEGADRELVETKRKSEPDVQYNENGRRTYTAHEVGGEFPPGVTQVKLLGDDWSAREHGDLLLYLEPKVAYMRDPQTGACYIQRLNDAREVPVGYAVTQQKLKWRVHSGAKFKTETDVFALQGSGKQSRMVWSGRVSSRA